MSETISPNTTLAHYSVICRIAAGGMGEVYLALDTKLDRKVALKILPPDLASNQDRMRRFVQEAKTAAALNHPNIAHIYEIGDPVSLATAASSTVSESTSENLIHFIAMEFIDGQTLREKLRAGDMNVNESIDVATHVASALSAAHDAGIVHRDIKPENVMISGAGVVKVLDFGLAKLSEDSFSAPVDSEALTRAVINTEPGVVMGTALYMSPEQARGLQVDERTDIFGLGVVIYEMITNRLPFEGANTNEILTSILGEREPQPLARYVREVPVELERIVSKALRKNRDERYQTTKDLLLDLKSLKQELEFERKLERSLPPGGEGGGSNFSSPLVSRNSELASATRPRTVSVSSGEYFFSRISEHKRGALLVLSVLFLAILSYWLFSHRSANVTTIDSIAVMPFENMTHDQKTEYLSDGVTESLINSLSQLPHIKVIARNSVFSYKNQTPNLQQVAQRLNVQALLTGRVLMEGDMLDVRVELTDAQNNTQLWGDHYTRKAADIFAVQDEIARQVTDTLRVRLTGAQQEQVTKRYTENAEAYRLYLQGRYYMNEFTEENLNRAVAFFDQAIALDPRYALAYAARGESFFEMGDLSLPMSEAKPKAKQDIAAALGIDDKLVEARTILANIKFQYEWDFTGAEPDFKQAIALNPNYAEGHHQYAWYLAINGRPLEGLAEMTLAQQLDPVNPSINVDVCLPYYLARQFEQSVVQARKSVEMFPNFFLAHLVLGGSLVQTGDYSAGITELQKAKAIEANPPVIGQLGFAYAKSGRKNEARKLVTELKELSKGRYVAPFWIAIIYVGLDEKDEAFAWFEKAYKERSWFLAWIKMEPMVDSLRSDLRFIDLMQRIGFPHKD